MNLEHNKKIAFEFFDAMAHRQLEKWVALMDDSLEWWIIGNGAVSGWKTKGDLIIAVQNYWGLMEDPLMMKFEDITAEDDRVALIASIDAKTKSGKSYRNQYNILLTIRDGKIVRGREYFDTARAADLLGA